MTRPSCSVGRISDGTDTIRATPFKRPGVRECADGVVKKDPQVKQQQSAVSYKDSLGRLACLCPQVPVEKHIRDAKFEEASVDAIWWA